MKLIFIKLISLLFFISCTQSPPLDHEENNSILIDQLPEDFVVPQVVWDSMKPKFADEKEKPIIYTSVKVFFNEKNKNVLKKSKLIYEFNRGGGDLDLSSVIGDKPGTFFLKFELPEFENAFQKKAFFISQSRQRKVDGEVLGSGCRIIFDISTELYKQMNEKGIKINTTRDRHDSVLGGHLIFFAESEKNWLLSQVTFFDSKRTDLFCKNFRTATAEVQ